MQDPAETKNKVIGFHFVPASIHFKRGIKHHVMWNKNADQMVSFLKSTCVMLPSIAASLQEGEKTWIRYL